MEVLKFSAPTGVDLFQDLEASAVFTQGSLSITRPLFWSGGSELRAAFAAPSEGDWTWTTEGLPGGEQSGVLSCPAERLLTMSPCARNAQWTDGTPFFPVADTAWALPYRATVEEAEEWAADRASKGFTAALLMAVQPDRDAEGPEDRTALHGFGRGFHDLHLGSLNSLNPDYFAHLDLLVQVLQRHGIVPIWVPLFSGFGWKGLRPVGEWADPAQAARFARYLVARYGAQPAMWLVGGDGTGHQPSCSAAGREVHEWDDYGQPTGIHYNPWQTSDAHWDEPWCDFHLCQTGHSGDHRPDRVTEMHWRTPARGVANGEPTYEGMGGGKYGLGDWQRVEAWENLCAGGTFGTFYGAGSLWQWKRKGETVWDGWSSSEEDWRGALSFEGSRAPGVVGRLLQDLPFAGMSPTVEMAKSERCVGKKGEFCLAYLPMGGHIGLEGLGAPSIWRAHSAKTGDLLLEGELPAMPENPFMGHRLDLPSGEPLAVIHHRRQN